MRPARFRKVIAFFTGAAAEAGIELSPHLKVRATGGPRRPRGKGKRKAEPKVETPPPAPPPAAPQDMRAALLAKFPDFNPDWPDDLKTKWFEGFERFMKGVESGK